MAYCFFIGNPNTALLLWFWKWMQFFYVCACVYESGCGGTHLCERCESASHERCKLTLKKRIRREIKTFASKAVNATQTFLFLPSFTRPGMKLSRCVIGERLINKSRSFWLFSSALDEAHVSHLCTQDKERVYDYGGADNNSVNEREYDRKWFIHVGKCMLGNGTKLAGVTINGCPNLTGKNGGFLKQIQDKTTERIQNWSWYFCSVLHTRRCSVTSC